MAPPFDPSGTSLTKPLAAFTDRLFQDGNVAVPPIDALLSPSSGDLAETETVIRRSEATLRLAAPGRPPALDVSASIWAVQAIAWAGATILDRQQVRTQLPAGLSLHMPDRHVAASHWSVDVAMRFWPVICQRARRIAAEDELHPTLESIASLWPLSCVGMSVEPEPRSLACVLADPALLRLLVDRVTATSDRRLAGHPVVGKVLVSDAGASAETFSLQRLLKPDNQRPDS